MNTRSHETNELSNKQSKNIEHLLRGEISAVKAYEQVMDLMNSLPESKRLEEFKNDHSIAVTFWKNQVSDKRDIPEDFSGAWGTFVNAFVGTAKLIGNTPALKVLKEGEEHGLEQYRSFLRDKNTKHSNKDYVNKVLIPNQERHINSINAMMRLQ